MKNIYILLICKSLLVNAFSQIQICAGSSTFLNPLECNTNPWILEFEDNFDNNQLDLNKWTYRYPWMSSDGLAYYTLGNN